MIRDKDVEPRRLNKRVQTCELNRIKKPLLFKTTLPPKLAPWYYSKFSLKPFSKPKRSNRNRDFVNFLFSLVAIPQN